MPKTPSGTAFDLAGPETAPVVTMIHGLGLNHQVTWEAIAPALASKYRVLRYDLLGHGASDLPTGAITLSRLAKQLLDLMDHLGIAQSALVGFSLGGMINRRLTLDYPERVSALAILNSPHERDPDAQAKYVAAARDSASGGPEVTVDAALDRWFTEGFHDAHPKQVARFRNVVIANDVENYSAHRYVLAAGVTELIRPDPPIDLPTLVMTCEYDTGSTPAMAWSIAAETQAADVVIVPELRHLGLIEQPELFISPLLRFLDHATNA